MKAKTYEWVVKTTFKDGWEFIDTKNMTVKEFNKYCWEHAKNGNKVELLYSTQWTPAYAAKHDKRKVSA